MGRQLQVTKTKLLLNLVSGVLLVTLFLLGQGCSGGGGTASGVVATNTWTNFSITKPGFSNPETIRLVGNKLIMWKFGFGGEYYDFATSAWTTMSTTGAPTLTSRNATATNGRFMLLCGLNSGAYAGGVYDSLSNTWRSFANCSIFGNGNDFEMTATINNKFYFAEKEIDLSTGAYTNAVFTPPYAIAGQLGITNGSRIAFSNGINGYYFDSSLMPVSYPTQNVLNSRSGPATASVGNKLYVFAGSELIAGSYQWQADGATFSPDTNLWTNMASNTGPVSPILGSPPRVFTIGQKIYAVYQSGLTTMLANVFDSDSKLWSDCSEVNKPAVGNMALSFSTGSSIIILTNRNGNIYSGAFYNP